LNSCVLKGTDMLAVPVEAERLPRMLLDGINWERHESRRACVWPRPKDRRCFRAISLGTVGTVSRASFNPLDPPFLGGELNWGTPPNSRQGLVPAPFLRQPLHRAPTTGTPSDSRREASRTSFETGSVGRHLPQTTYDSSRLPSAASTSSLSAGWMCIPLRM
jgi:hypothetical protein